MPVGRLAYRPELDGIRGIAVLLVLLAHANVPSMAGGGMVGVTLFFVLSGYLITSLLRIELEQSGTISFRAFYKRRARRLIPALVVLLAVVGVLMVVMGRGNEYPAQLLAVALYSGNIGQSFGLDLGMLSGTWSLAVEEQFYIVWPVLFPLVGGRRMVPLLVIGVLATVIIRFMLEPGPLTYNRTDVRADALIWGCLLAFVPLKFSRWAALLASVALALVIVIEPDSFLIGLTAAALASTVIIAWARPGVLSMSPLVAVGKRSYGIYLWQMPVMFLLEPSHPVVMGAAIGLSLAIAWASYRWIEKPFLTKRHPALASDLATHIEVPRLATRSG